MALIAYLSLGMYASCMSEVRYNFLLGTVCLKNRQDILFTSFPGTSFVAVTALTASPR